MTFGEIKRKNIITPWLFVIPGLFFTILFRYLPVLQVAYYSLFDYDITKPPGKFTGMENYLTLITNDSFFRQAWINTGIFLILSLLLTFFIPVIQALFLSEVVRGRSLFSVIYILPAVIPGTIYIVLWKWIWNPQYGLANAILTKLGLPSQVWLGDAFWVKFCIVFPGIIGGGFFVLFYLAAILAIPGEIIESAMIDGCTGWKKIFYITLPNIKYLIFINIILSVIGTMQSFDAPFQFTKGGPAGAAYTVGIYIYDQFFNYIKLGKSSAAAVILFIVTIIMTTIQRRFDKSET